jgi:hypothetical protein
MRRFRAVLVLAVAVALPVATGSAFAAAPKAKPKKVAVKVTFNGSYAGQVTEKVDGQNVTALANGTGTGTVLGKGSVLGTVTATTANPPCSPLSGAGWLTGPKGKLKVMLQPTTSRGCAASEDDQNDITVSGTALVKGGTLLFSKATGSIHFSGTYDRSTFAFQIKLTGKFTYYKLKKK